jgi:DNA-binding CsgD family transcriptional regulator
MTNWKKVQTIPEFKEISGYLISDEGMVYSEKNSCEIGSVQTATGGYKVVSLSGIKSPLLVHRLVAMAFVDNPEDKPYVIHLDNNKVNNHASNLKWATKQESELHALKYNLHDNALDYNQALELKRLLRTTRASYKNLAERFGVSAHTVREISLGRIYAYVGEFEYPLRAFKKRAKRISSSVVETVKERLAVGMSQRKISAEFGIAVETVRKIREGRYDN